MRNLNKDGIFIRINNILDAIDNQKNIVIYGAGKHTDMLFKYTNIRTKNIKYIIDLNYKKIEKSNGYDVVSIKNLKNDHEKVCVVISSFSSQDSIYELLVSGIEFDGEIIKLYDLEQDSYPFYFDVYNLYGEKAVRDILKFFKEYNNFRSIEACSKVTSYSLQCCENVEKYLLENRLIGPYYFEKDSSPQKYMKSYILKKFKNINNKSKILEIGPGNNPIFSENEYKNWIALDINYDDDKNIIQFREKRWAEGKYKRVFKGGWENISRQCEINELGSEFDLVCGSHSYEHTFEPIKSLKEANRVLKKNGKLVLFVPDGFSLNPSNYDYTHTVYLIPDMIKEFFYYAGGFKDLNIEVFRPNLDLVITAVKI